MTREKSSRNWRRSEGKPSSFCGEVCSGGTALTDSATSGQADDEQNRLYHFVVLHVTVVAPSSPAPLETQPQMMTERKKIFGQAKPGDGGEGEERLPPFSGVFLESPECRNARCRVAEACLSQASAASLALSYAPRCVNASPFLIVICAYHLLLALFQVTPLNLFEGAAALFCGVVDDSLPATCQTIPGWKSAVRRRAAA